MKDKEFIIMNKYHTHLNATCRIGTVIELLKYDIEDNTTKNLEKRIESLIDINSRLKDSMDYIYSEYKKLSDNKTSGVDFINWTLYGDCTHQCTDQDQWTPNEYSTDNRVDSITTTELYDHWLWLTNKKN